MSYEHVRTKIICDECKKEAEVPFKPTPGRPVFCKACHEKKRVSR